MVSWDYRVIRTDYIHDGKTEPCFSVHRCYYVKDSDIPAKWGQQPASPEGETIEELKGDIGRLAAAAMRPILIVKRGKLQEAK